jgi:SAM-dependent methyltransferase
MPGDPERERLRRTFDEVAELYDRARPRYPDPLIDDLVRLAGLGPGSRIVEIGPGTGQATRPLAERGLSVTAVELGSRLAAVARSRLADLPTVELVEADFETWEPHVAGFDTVASFTAFHWIDPAARFAKAAALLRARGTLAVVGTEHVGLDDVDPFFLEIQEDYVAVAGEEEQTRPPHPDEIPGIGAEIEASGRFRCIAAEKHVWNEVYTAEEYVAVLETYSGHRAWGEDVRARLYDRVREKIARRPGGKITKTYLATLDVAERR